MLFILLLLTLVIDRVAIKDSILKIALVNNILINLII